MTKRHTGPGWPTYAAELLDARAKLTVADHVGLALRAHRRELALSQRAYAEHRRLSKSMVAKAELHAADLNLGHVMELLAGTGFTLCLATQHHVATGEPELAVVKPSDWDRTELLARVRGEGRRFPGHRQTKQVSSPPRWWWDRESTFARSVEPDWYSPQPRPWHRMPQDTAAQEDGGQRSA